jgi:hypothetical protein
MAGSLDHGRGSVERLAGHIEALAESGKAVEVEFASADDGARVIH